MPTLTYEGGDSCLAAAPCLVILLHQVLRRPPRWITAGQSV